jgi:hypothetical protein
MFTIFSSPSTIMARRAAYTAAILMAVYAVFQLYWAAGGSWGLNAVWGGEYDDLPANLRAASVVSAVIFILGAFIVRGRAGYRVPSIFPISVLRWGIWVIVAVSGLSTLANLASSSNWERFLNAPVALLMALLCLVVARSPRPWDTDQ